ncbi:MAG TPA: hypothetical protein VHD62_18810 [Opitutaceae bacterium]|nr:hypothetical protein [Opitutaceae bacterium]
MRRHLKVKALATGVPLRKAATSGSAASRRAFPAWIDAGDGAAFSATAVRARVRSSLVLRTVGKSKSAKPGNVSDDRPGK